MQTTSKPRRTKPTTTTEDTSADQLVTVQRAAAMLSVHRSTIFKLRNAGALTGVRIGRALRFRESEVRAIVRNGVAEIGGA
jgi:excisionase family DNA binding protein